MRLDGVPSGSQAAAPARRCDRLGGFTAALRSHCALIRSIASTTHVVQTFLRFRYSGRHTGPFCVRK